jgi:hypothetical protein
MTRRVHQLAAGDFLSALRAIVLSVRPSRIDGFSVVGLSVKGAAFSEEWPSDSIVTVKAGGAR